MLVFAFSEIELALLVIVDTCHLPSVIELGCVVEDFFGNVLDARHIHKNILKIFSKYFLILIHFKQSIHIINLTFKFRCQFFLR